jgi:hypothetical protein
MNYLDLGINAIAVNERKGAIFPWKEYQTRTITKQEFDSQMSDPRAKGVAIICGAISGNLEVIDVDTKYANFDLWQDIVNAIPKEIYGKLHIVNTISNGKHLYYRCDYIQSNQKLALRNATNEELKAHPHNKTYCIIETRGEGGYVVAPPSFGYSFIQQGINVISLDEREQLFEIMRSFNEVVEEVVIEAHNRPTTKDFGVSPFDDYNKRGDIRPILEANGWRVVKSNSERDYYLRPGSTSAHSGSYNKSLNLFSVFSTNTQFEPQKGYKNAHVFTLLECNGDWKIGAKRLLEMGYGEKRINFGDKLEKDLFEKKTDGATKDELITLLVKKYNKDLKNAEDIVIDLEQRWGDKICTFWDIDKNGRPIISKYKLQIFLTEQGGFRLYFYDDQSTIYRLIRIKDGFVEEASSEQVKKFIKDYIDRLPDSFDGGITPQDLLELIYKNAVTLFSVAFFEFFSRADIDFLRDTKEEAYFPFKNGVVQITKNDIKLVSYGELGKVIWKSQVIDHFIIVDQEGIQPENIEYFKFLQRISGDQQERYMYAISLIGYLLHQYKDPARPFAVILAEETDNEEKGGGTGKGIFVKALSYIAKTIRVDGKNFKVDKNFAFQRVDLDTRIVAIEDTRKKVDFEGFYSIITEGITVEKKNKDELFIPYKDSPKILFTTNYSIPQNGVHAKRRQRVFEFAPYFGATHTPEDEFKHKLFDDWDKDEWNRFYNLLFFALSDYLAHGVVNIPFSEKMAKKALKNQFGDEFVEHFEEIIKNEEWVSIDQLHQEFLNMYGMDKKEYSRIRYKRGIKSGTELYKVEHFEEKNKVERGKIAIRFSRLTDIF